MNMFASRQELDAQVAMIMLQSPFPPLPIVMINAEGEEKMASGHDLLSQALSVSMLSYTTQTNLNEDLMHRKQSILMQLNAKISNMWKLEVEKFMKEAMLMDKAMHPDSEQNEKQLYNYIWKRVWREIPVQRCYDIYCTLFREYLSCYPGSRDLRIYPLDAVTMDTTIYKHALEHIQAREAYVRDDIFEMESTTDPETAFKPPSAARVPAVKQNIHSYADILRLYAMAMFFESSEYVESFL